MCVGRVHFGFVWAEEVYRWGHHDGFRWINGAYVDGMWCGS